MGLIEAIQALLPFRGLSPRPRERTGHGAIVVSKRALEALHKSDVLVGEEADVTTFAASVLPGPELVSNPGGDNRFDPKLDPPGLKAPGGRRYRG